MIVKMKKTTIAVLSDYKDDALNRLQDIGVLHVHYTAEATAETADRIRDQLGELHRALSALESAAPGRVTAETDAKSTKGWETVQRTILQLADNQDSLQEADAQVAQQIEAQKIWGNFNPERVHSLAAHQVYVKLYRCPPASIPEIPEDCVMHEVRRDPREVAFAVIGPADFTLPIAETRLPEKSLSELEAKRAEIADSLTRIQNEIKPLLTYAPLLNAAEKQLRDDLARAQVHDRLANLGTISYLQGFCPVDRLPALEAAANSEGWGLIVEKPAPEDRVPTLLRNPAWVRPIEAAYKFIDTLPGYFEMDVSPVFLIFLSLFYAILVGDAGYGSIYLLIVICVHVWKGKNLPKEPLYLLYICNIMTILWGVATGTYFGINLPAAAFLNKIAFIDSSNMFLMMKICFFIAAIHLTIAHGINTIRYINSLTAIAEFGRILMAWGAYFLANTLILGESFPHFMIWAGGGGIILALVFSGVWKDFGDLFQFIFGIINFFGDTVSYLRLFAVGYATVVLAQAFNTLATGMSFDVFIKGPLMILVLFIGHGLNLVLCPIAVLVHGLRLNLLEFSGHLGQEWSGVRYAPLQRSTESIEGKI